MALYIQETAKYLAKTTPTVLGSSVWTTVHKIGSIVPASGIYRCEGCGDEITSNKGTEFPPQNKHQHPGSSTTIGWRLIVETQTKG
ncbi:protein L [Pseudomonas sp. WS 5406]|uniref:protein L n=1 Tax=Pseudomonas sp. WS 5406 TaxID=2717498 RepID=UPI001474984F|nr:protein L [Pseudomonas sp. WS 5406]NMX26271.1 protein L [Pseudomonas sp. WS 5406]